MRKKGEQGQRFFETRPDIGWVVLAGVTLLFFVLCRIPLFFLPAGENERLIVGFLVYLAFFLYSIVYGGLSLRLTGKVLLPALMLAGFAALTFLSEGSGTLDQIQSVKRPPGYAFALLLYFWKSLRFSAVSAVIGGAIKNLKG